MSVAAEFVVASDHPALPGHFPGRPVVPGVVLLDHVLEAAHRLFAGRRPTGLPSVKFLRPVRAEERVEMRLAEAGERILFGCFVGDVEVARGAIACEAAP